MREMLNATDFTYDGVFSGVYGLQIASMNDSVVEETSYVTPTITTVKPSKAKRFYYMDSKYEETPTFEFSIISANTIPDLVQRDILRWLDNRKGFKTLIIHQPEFDSYTYNCIFSVTSIIYHAGCCIGFNLRAMFDSPYHYAASKKIRVTGSGTVQDITVYNNSDIIDDYVYPTVKFKLNSNGSLIIYNKTDDAACARGFKFTNIAANTQITVDNELKIISSNTSADYLDKFDGKKWLRLVRGKNVLQIQVNGEVEITFPQYIKIRF